MRLIIGAPAFAPPSGSQVMCMWTWHELRGERLELDHRAGADAAGDRLERHALVRPELRVAEVRVEALAHRPLHDLAVLGSDSVLALLGLPDLLDVRAPLRVVLRVRHEREDLLDRPLDRHRLLELHLIPRLFGPPGADCQELAITPPSTKIISPLTKLAAGPARKSATLATSIGLREPAERDPVSHHLHELGVRRGLLHHRRGHEAGRDPVHRDPVLAPLRGQLLHEQVHAGLRRPVGREAPPPSHHAPRGREVDDPPPVAPFDHRPAGRLRQPERAAEVGVDDLIPGLGRHLLGRSVALDPGRVHEHVEAAEPLGGGLDALPARRR